MSYYDISVSNVFSIKRTVFKTLMIEVTMKEIVHSTLNA